jgi:hypothetical protein
MNVAVQVAVYNQLSTNAPLLALVNNVYDEIPQKSDYPYVAVGDDTLIEWDTDTFRGTEATVVVHSWSRYDGRREVKSIMDAVYNALHRQVFDIPGGVMVLSNVEFQETFLESDGRTRHGVQRVRLIVQGAEHGS